jgi:ceramide glucosyltransferase
VVCATTVPEAGLDALLRHELRWARTILSLVPAEFVASAIQYPLAWAALAVALSGGAAWTLGFFALAWAGRAVLARGLDASLGLVQPGLATPAPIWLLPLRDLLSLAVVASSIISDRVEWRGHILHATREKSAGEAASAVAAQGRVTYATFGGASQ